MGLIVGTTTGWLRTAGVPLGERTGTLRCPGTETTIVESQPMLSTLNARTSF